MYDFFQHLSTILPAAIPTVLGAKSLRTKLKDASVSVSVKLRCQRKISMYDVTTKAYNPLHPTKIRESQSNRQNNFFNNCK